MSGPRLGFWVAGLTVLWARRGGDQWLRDHLETRLYGANKILTLGFVTGKVLIVKAGKHVAVLAH